MVRNSKRYDHTSLLLILLSVATVIIAMIITPITTPNRKMIKNNQQIAEIK